MKKYLMWMLEVLIWFLIIVTVIMGVFLYKHIKLKQKHSYHVFFTDTDGLRNGSPVKIMGNEIGYVSNVKVINNDEIFVSFVITTPQINIPTGSLANIESAGLVGSRSLEIYPPKTNDMPEAELIIPQNPSRVQGVYTNSSRTANIIYAAATTVNKAVRVEQIPFVRSFIREKYKETTGFSDKIDKINDSQDKALNLIKGNKKLKDFNMQIERMAK